MAYEREFFDLTVFRFGILGRQAISIADRQVHIRGEKPPEPCGSETGRSPGSRRSGSRLIPSPAITLQRCAHSMEHFCPVGGSAEIGRLNQATPRAGARAKTGLSMRDASGPLVRRCEGIGSNQRKGTQT